MIFHMFFGLRIGKESNTDSHLPRRQYAGLHFRTPSAVAFPDPKVPSIYATCEGKISPTPMHERHFFYGNPLVMKLEHMPENHRTV